MGNEFIPYTYTKTYQTTPTSAGADRQLMRASWPIGMWAELESITITSQIASGGQVVLWDQDLSNTTPTSRGSAGGALAIFGAPAGAVSAVSATTTQFGGDGRPKPKAYAGFAFQATQLNLHISALIRHRR